MADGKKKREKKKKIMMKIVATNVVASRPPERQGSPATTIARANILFAKSKHRLGWLIECHCFFKNVQLNIILI